MAEGYNGADTLLLVNVGSESAPDFEAVASQRDVNFNQSIGEIETSAKGDDQATYIAGRYSAEISLSALWVPDASDEAQAKLRTASRERGIFKVRRQFLGEAIEEADAIITGMDEANPDNDVSTLDMTIRVASAWTPVGS